MHNLRTVRTVPAAEEGPFHHTLLTTLYIQYLLPRPLISIHSYFMRRFLPIPIPFPLPFSNKPTQKGYITHGVPKVLQDRDLKGPFPA